jgi:hypothetical protein
LAANYLTATSYQTSTTGATNIYPPSPAAHKTDTEQNQKRDTSLAKTSAKITPPTKKQKRTEDYDFSSSGSSTFSSFSSSDEFNKKEDKDNQEKEDNEQQEGDVQEEDNDDHEEDVGNDAQQHESTVDGSQSYSHV